MDERSDWVEIIEPRSWEHMYVNLLTGECGWEPPLEVRVRKADEKQWWELFDQHSNRFYYYNAISQQTVWHRPQNCDIVPLAQLQAMKHNSQLELQGHLHRKNSDGRNTPVNDTLVQEAAKNRADSLENCKDSGRETPDRWQPAPGTKAAMLVKVHSLKHSPISSTSSGQQQEGPNSGSNQKPLSRSVIYFQSQQAAQIPVPIRTSFSKETKRSVEIRNAENRGFCSVFTDGASYHTPQSTSTGTPQPESPKYALPPPLYDEPSLDSPIYDEPPVEMDTEGVTGGRTITHVLPNNNLQKWLKSTKLLPHPSMQQQTSNKHRRNQSATEYSPYGRECIKHMVIVDQSSKQLTAPYGTSEVSVKQQSGQITSKDSFKQCWRVLEASVLKDMEAHDSCQNSLQTQEYATVISQQDSGYSTGPSPSLRKRRGRKQGAIETRLGSVGSSSELNMLNDRLIAEMRVVVGHSAMCKWSKANLDADMVETAVLSESSKVRFQSEPLKKYGSCGSRDDVRTSSGSLYRPVVESKANGSSDFSAQQDVVRQKRAYEKIDSLAKTLISQTNLVSSESQTASQSGTLETNSKTEAGLQPSIPEYHFPYSTIRKPLSENSMVDWASKNLNMHTQGIFRRRISIANMLSWNGGSIKKPMLITSSHMIKKEACEMFKLVQMYMGDRQTRTDRNHVALAAITKCWSIQGLRDEMYIQLVRQTTDNMFYRSLTLGWELMAISLAFFSPSPKFQSYLEGYIYRHLDQLNDENIIQHIKELQELKNKKNSKSRKKRKQNAEEEGLSISTYAKYCYRKLQKVAVTGGKKGLKKPSMEEIEHSRNAIHIPSLFGSSLEEIMLRQQDTFPDHRLPWVQTQLSQQVLALGGERTEGIFRVPGDIDEVNALKLQVDQWQIPDNLEDPTVPASLLKLWYRELEEPLIPQQFYKQCISNYENPDAAVAVVQLLPELNRLVLCYLIHFLQIFAQPMNVGTTKMDVNNLAMVMAPNCLRCQSDDPRVIFENTRKEMSFLRMLIVHLDTSFMSRIL